MKEELDFAFDDETSIKNEESKAMDHYVRNRDVYARVKEPSNDSSGLRLAL